MENQLTKHDHNKKNYAQHKPYPVRLGILKELIMNEAIQSDRSGHYIIIKKLEECFAPQLRVLEQQAAARFTEVLELLKLDWNSTDALKKLKIDKTLFFRGINNEQRNEIAFYTRRTQEKIYNFHKNNQDYKKKKTA